MSAESVALSSVHTTSEPTERLLGFSDALFGIAITFLALDFGTVPAEVRSREVPVASFLSDQVRDYAVYAATFLVVGFLWSRHHQMFRYIKGRSTSLIVLNLFLLALVALLPYPAALVGRSFGLGLAVAVLLLPLTLIAVLLGVIWEVALRERLTIPDLPAATVATFRAGAWSVAGALGLGLALALLSWRTGNQALSYLAMGCGLLLVVVPPIVRLRWPTPAQATYLPPHAEVLAAHEAKHETLVRGLLEQIRTGSDLTRLCAFTDGVFAIAVTVLALQLRPPPAEITMTNQAVVDNLIDVPWEIYLMTFVFIGLYWITHVHTFEQVNGADTTLIALNLIFLLVIAMLPLPTALVNLVGEDADSWIFYFGILFAICLVLVVLRLYTMRKVDLTLDAQSPQELRYSLARTTWAAAACLLSIVLIAVTRDPAYAAVAVLAIIVRAPILRRFFPGVPDPNERPHRAV